MTKYDLRMVSGLCKALAGKFQTDGQNFNCHFEKGQYDKKQEFKKKVEEYRLEE
jgi:hypothetical protein